VQAGLKRALATYAVARTINGVVSVVQETGVAVQPGGFGMTFAPGQLLDPINDLVEQVSSVMLAVSVSYGIQLLLLHLGRSILVSAVVTGAILGCVVLWWRRRRRGRFKDGLLQALTPPPYGERGKAPSTFLYLFPSTRICRSSLLYSSAAAYSEMFPPPCLRSRR